MTRRCLAILAGAFALMLAMPGAPAQAQNFPTKPITLVIPWPPGGPTDRHLRVLADIAGKHLGQPVIVDNKPGASGTMGGALVAGTAKPDGYTVVQLPLTIFRLPYMQKTTWDPKKDFSYIIHLTGYTLGVAVHADSPWMTWKDLLTYAKANPTTLRYGTSGTGSTPHLTMERIAEIENIKWTQVPFKGEAESSAALLGKHVEVLASGTGLFPLVQAGQLRMLVVWTEQRALQFPEVPTLMEAGQNLISASPYGLAGPKGMDPKIMKILHDAFHKALLDPAHIKMLNDISQPVMYKNSADYAAFALQQIAEQQEMIAKLGLGAK